MAYRLALAQFSPEKGRVDDNLDRIADLASQAAGEGADLVAFPEAAVSGYDLEMGLVEKSVSTEWLEQQIRSRLPAGPACLVGFYEDLDGDVFNSAALYYDGSIVDVYRKFFLPTYGVFEERRYLSPGNQPGLIDSPFGRLGVLICEDVWHSILPTVLAVGGAQTMLVLSASPARGFAGERPGNLLRYERMLRAIAEEHGVYAATSMLCGFEGGKGFTGGSVAFDPFGRMITQAPLMEESIVLADIDAEEIKRARATAPLIDDLRQRLPDIVRALKEIEEARP